VSPAALHMKNSIRTRWFMEVKKLNTSRS